MAYAMLRTLTTVDNSSSTTMVYVHHQVQHCALGTTGHCGVPNVLTSYLTELCAKHQALAACGCGLPGYLGTVKCCTASSSCNAVAGQQACRQVASCCGK